MTVVKNYEANFLLLLKTGKQMIRFTFYKVLLKRV